MKKFIGWSLSWTFYSCGLFVSLFIDFQSSFYILYSWLMKKSINFQDWGGSGPWIDLEINKS